VQIVRYPGVVAQRAIGPSLEQASLSTASGWARTIVVSFSAAVAGTGAAANTVSLKITCVTSDGLAAYLRYSARFLFGGKVGGTSMMELIPR